MPHNHARARARVSLTGTIFRIIFAIYFMISNKKNDAKNIASSYMLRLSCTCVHVDVSRIVQERKRERESTSAAVVYYAQ